MSITVIATPMVPCEVCRAHAELILFGTAKVPTNPNVETFCDEHDARVEYLLTQAEAAFVDALRKCTADIQSGHQKIIGVAPELPRDVRVVVAPGDRCGNTKRLPTGEPCPGCRACA